MRASWEREQCQASPFVAGGGERPTPRECAQTTSHRSAPSGDHTPAFPSPATPTQTGPHNAAAQSGSGPRRVLSTGVWCAPVCGRNPRSEKKTTAAAVSLRPGRGGQTTHTIRDCAFRISLLALKQVNKWCCAVRARIEAGAHFAWELSPRGLRACACAWARPVPSNTSK